MSSSEEHRHRCEVRWCLRQGWDFFREYIIGVRAKRGEEAARQLWDDVKDQAAKGSAGENGIWL